MLSGSACDSDSDLDDFDVNPSSRAALRSITPTEEANGPAPNGATLNRTDASISAAAGARHEDCASVDNSFHDTKTKRDSGKNSNNEAAMPWMLGRRAEPAERTPARTNVETFGNAFKAVGRSVSLWNRCWKLCEGAGPRPTHRASM